MHIALEHDGVLGLAVDHLVRGDAHGILLVGLRRLAGEQAGVLLDLTLEFRRRHGLALPPPSGRNRCGADRRGRRLGSRSRLGLRRGLRLELRGGLRLGRRCDGGLGWDRLWILRRLRLGLGGGALGSRLSDRRLRGLGLGNRRQEPHLDKTDGPVKAALRLRDIEHGAPAIGLNKIQTNDVAGLQGADNGRARVGFVADAYWLIGHAQLAPERAAGHSLHVHAQQQEHGCTCREESMIPALPHGFLSFLKEFRLAGVNSAVTPPAAVISRVSRLISTVVALTVKSGGKR